MERKEGACGKHGEGGMATDMQWCLGRDVIPALKPAPHGAEDRSGLEDAGRVDVANLMRELDTLRAYIGHLQCRFDLIVQATSDGLWDLEIGDSDGSDPDTPCWLSGQFRRLLGYGPLDELPHRLGTWSSRLHPDDRARVLNAFAAHVGDRSGQTPYDVTYRLRCRDGSYRWIRALGRTLRAPDGRALRVAGAMTDITDSMVLLDLKRYAEDIAARYRDQASLLDKTTDAVVVRGLDGRIQFWNKSAERMYGWSSEEATGRLVAELIYDDHALLDDITGRILTHGEWRGEIRHRRKDGTTFPVEGHWTLVLDEAGEPKAIMVINTDITQRKAAEQKIRVLAMYDSLTGLPNRTLCMESLGRALLEARMNDGMLAVLFMDLNRFKEINDTRGHGVGDQVLVQVARRFQAVLGKGEILSRLAGDEFIVATPVANRDAASELAQRLQGALTDPVAAADHTFFMRVSVGIAVHPMDGATIDDLLKRADIAMYRAKRGGGGHVFYEPEMSDGLAERMELAKDLARALDNGELQLHYQPKVDLGTGAMVGAEALLRWYDPRRGWVSPADFIPIAEGRGMMVPLGRWVLREACRQMKAWQRQGLHFSGRLAINLAAQELDDGMLASNIVDIVRAADLAPSSFELELTESGLMGDVERAIVVMAALKTAGFALSIDDFGTGYSSLAYLKRLPVDKLKIDISFVRDMLNDRHDHTIVTTILGMAHNLGLSAIAEGVERAEQADALRAMGCDEAQGYYYGRPQPAQVFARTWLTAQPG
ncbi:putative bifunctional diguanylate cyclase/phosphodiesterase [Achromobacter aloeverae]|uniref:putative bifunctional diguanylate cyclase/phosphodiesterase n=1 Tax=Achromobacter aloeverae TaxID=1750518 RepID=UPI0018651C15|nr:EAL domain-containing protein [Achromobacter aloeverae]